MASEPEHATAVLGVDVGGAAIKACDAEGRRVHVVKFPLWKNPQGLEDQLSNLRCEHRPRHVAVTMTGELCDCFRTKADGVRAILDSVALAFPEIEVAVWTVYGRFVSPGEAMKDPWRAAASNWHALATCVSPWTKGAHALLLDAGSTTTDVIPIRQGRPAAQGSSDPERLANAELVYTGVERTPICALLPQVAIRGRTYRTMAELFATTGDVHLVLGQLDERPHYTDTADGRPATIDGAVARLARMIGSDASRFDLEDARELAAQVRQQQIQLLLDAMNAVVAESLDGRVDLVITSGQGEFLLHAALDQSPWRDQRRIAVTDRLGANVSTAACAYAVARLLASEKFS